MDSLAPLLSKTFFFGLELGNCLKDVNLMLLEFDIYRGGDLDIFLALQGAISVRKAKKKKKFARSLAPFFSDKNP